jgi:tellurite methyltransferase
VTKECSSSTSPLNPAHEGAEWRGRIFLPRRLQPKHGKGGPSLSHQDRLKWDEKYRAGAYAERTHPTPLLTDWVPQAKRGRALDVACGAGRNSLFLAARGFVVDAVDISAAGLERAKGTAEAQGVHVHWIEADLEADAASVLPHGPYDLIVMVRYVNASLYPLLLDRLAGNGLFVCEEHLVSDEDVIGPTNPAYRLSRDELRHSVTAAATGEDEVLYYREGRVADPDGRNAALAQLVLRRHPSAH